MEREDPTVEQYIVVVDDSRCEVHETSYGNAIPRSLKSIGLTMNQDDDTDLNLYYNAYSHVKVGDIIDKDRVIHIGNIYHYSMMKVKCLLKSVWIALMLHISYRSMALRSNKE